MRHPGTGQIAPVPAPMLIGPAMPRHRAEGGAATGAAGTNGTGGAGTGGPGTGETGKAVGTPGTIAPAHQLPHPHLLWVQEHLHHLSISAQTVSDPALRLAEIRQRPWWR